MPLKVKVILGFAAICLIFISIGAALGFFLAKIKSGSDVITSVILPSNGKAAELKYSITYEGLKIADFDSSSQKVEWEKAMELREGNLAGVSALEGGIGSLID